MKFVGSFLPARYHPDLFNFSLESPFILLQKLRQMWYLVSNWESKPCPPILQRISIPHIFSTGSINVYIHECRHIQFFLEEIENALTYFSFACRLMLSRLSCISTNRNNFCALYGLTIRRLIAGSKVPAKVSVSCSDMTLIYSLRLARTSAPN